MSKNKFLLPFILICILFFLWAFLHNINGILIPHLKKVCQLNDTQSSLIDFAVYFGYFVIAIPAGLFSHKFGYKKGILFGLFLFALGALLFYPAADSRNFILFLVALFIAASGATFLETVANPYATVLGNPETSEQRLNFAQSFNGLGAFVAPLIGTHYILSGIEHTQAELDAMKVRGELEAYLQQEANSLKPPYLIIAGVLVLVAVLFIFTKLPEVREEDGGHGTKFSLSVFKIPHVRWAVIAEFFYVGSQVGVLSFFIRFSRFTANIPEKEAGDILTYFAMLGFMAGRFLGTFFMRYVKPQRLLSIYSAIAIGLLVIALVTKGSVAVYAVAATPFFMSIMFPTIFALGIKDLGAEEKKLASSFLVMSIIGGAFTPLMMGLISDKTGSIQIAYIMPIICFLFILYFGLRGHKTNVKPAAV